MEFTPDLNQNEETVVNNTSNNVTGVAANLALRSTIREVSDLIYESSRSTTKSSEPQKEQYTTQVIMTMTQEEILLKLYDEIISQLNIAIKSIDKKSDVVKRNASLQKAQNIINHLRMTLDFRYEVSKYLSVLYDFSVKSIIEANVKNISQPLIDILPIIVDLKDSCSKDSNL